MISFHCLEVASRHEMLSSNDVRAWAFRFLILSKQYPFFTPLHKTVYVYLLPDLIHSKKINKTIPHFRLMYHTKWEQQLLHTRNNCKETHISQCRVVQNWVQNEIAWWWQKDRKGDNWTKCFYWKRTLLGTIVKMLSFKVKRKRVQFDLFRQHNFNHDNKFT